MRKYDKNILNKIVHVKNDTLNIYNIYLESIDLCKRSELINICKNYRAYQKEFYMGFNVFSFLTGSKYQNENLHSDFLYEILRPDGSHGMGDIFFKQFFEFIKQVHREIVPYSRPSIQKESYTLSENKKGYIDILIKNEEENDKRAIIIENKIGGARDQEDQLFRYYNALKKEGYEIDAILYITGNWEKKLKDINYSNEYRNFRAAIEGKKLFKNILYYSPSNMGISLHNGFFQKCENISKHNMKIYGVIRQYTDLVKYIGGNEMNETLMENFIDQLSKDPEQVRIIQEAKDLLDETKKYYPKKLFKDIGSTWQKKDKNVKFIDNAYKKIIDKNIQLAIGIDSNNDWGFFYNTEEVEFPEEKINILIDILSSDKFNQYSTSIETEEPELYIYRHIDTDIQFEKLLNCFSDIVTNTIINLKELENKYR